MRLRPAARLFDLQKYESHIGRVLALSVKRLIRSKQACALPVCDRAASKHARSRYATAQTAETPSVKNLQISSMPRRARMQTCSDQAASKYGAHGMRPCKPRKISVNNLKLSSMPRRARMHTCRIHKMLRRARMQACRILNCDRRADWAVAGKEACALKVYVRKPLKLFNLNSCRFHRSVDELV